MINPCYKCKDRTLLCHDTCQSYRDFKESREKAHKRDMEYRNYLYDAMSRMKTSRR